MTQQVYDGPPDYRSLEQHSLSVAVDHDEAERFNFLAQMNRHLATRVMPGVKRAFDHQIEPEFKAREGRAFIDRHEVRRALADHPRFRWWSALRRNTMESRQQAGRSVVLKRAKGLYETARSLLEGSDRLALDPSVAVPRYISAVDHHCMPGSYYTELVPGDVTQAANYDAGLFVTTGGELGRLSDGAGRAVAAWIRKHLPDLRPRRILDMGCGLGHNLLPLATEFPDAEVIGVDVGAPMLRYGAARAAALGITNARFVQGDAANLSKFDDGSFDVITSIMFLHETSHSALQQIFGECNRLLSANGLVLHVEQPRYDPTMSAFEQAMRDWDAFYNNEPFWTKVHEIDLDGFLVAAGFEADQLIHGDVAAVPDPALFPHRVIDTAQEDYGRRAAWQVIGARKSCVSSEHS